MDLTEALGAEPGTTTCVVGAGGKKTALWTLAGRVPRAVVTASVRVPTFLDDHVERTVVTDDPAGALADAAPEDFPLGLVPAREGNRYLGYETGVVDELAGAAGDEAVLVKADGARNREFKAPNDDEPRIPASTDTVLAIASAHVVGRPLDEQWVHRPERVAAITGLDDGDTIRAEHVAQVLASERGGRKGVPDGTRVVPVVNKVDDDEDERVARDVAAGIHDRCDVPYVALTCLRDGRLVDTVE